MSADSTYRPLLEAKRKHCSPPATPVGNSCMKSAVYLDTFAPSPLVEENTYRHRPTDTDPVPSFAASRDQLPVPFWDGHDEAIDCYWHTWELAFNNLRQPIYRSLIANYIDTAFNSCIFMWDSVFILQFCRYGQRAFHFQRTLDNLYATQNYDGFITRELRPDGTYQFHPHDLNSTGPNLLAWSEWCHYQSSSDEDRLACVFPVLLAYHRWLRMHRTWQDGTYFSSGLGCGMDNMPRLGGSYEPSQHHGHMSWIDSTAQAALSAALLVRMGTVLNRENEVSDEAAEYDRLKQWVRTVSWDDERGFCFDVDRSGKRTGHRHLGSFWSLLAGLLDDECARRLAAHLDDERAFKRPHRPPCLAADEPGYSPTGSYWRGSVWPPTTWLVLKGLERYGLDDLAHDIAVGHHEAVLQVWKETGTVWENYAPETIGPGEPAKPDFVGWSGLGPIAVLLEHRFGLRPDVPAAKLIWDIRVCEAHGVEGYPFGPKGVLDLHCAGRASTASEPQITVTSSVPLTITIRWQGGSKDIALKGEGTL